MTDERAEARLTAPSVHLLGEHGALERERELCRQCSQGRTDRLRRCGAPRDDEQPSLAVRRRKVECQNAVMVGRHAELG